MQTGKIRKKVADDFDQDLLRDALRSGLYKKSNIWTDSYLKWRTENFVLLVAKELPDDYVNYHINLLRILDDIVYDFNYKKWIGGFILKNICPKLTGRFYVKNKSNLILIKKV